MADHGPGIMNVFKRFRKNSCDLLFTDPSGVLREKVDTSIIKEANKEVTTIIVDLGESCSPMMGSQQF